MVYSEINPASLLTGSYALTWKEGDIMNRFRSGKSAAAILLSAVMAISTAGCAGGSKATETTANISTATGTSEATSVTTAETTAAEKTNIRISALKGPTGIGLVSLMEAQEAGTAKNNYSFTLTGTPDDIVAQLSSGEADIAALPTNLAAVLYQKTNKSISVIAVNTLGVLYILEKGDTVHSMADLAGREIMATGQGAVPEYALNDLLAKANLSTPAAITYMTEHSELATLAAAGKASDLIMLPEPFVTTVLGKNPEYRIALDLTEEWKKAYGEDSGSELAMGCLAVSAKFAAEHPEALETFLQEYKASTDSVNADPSAAGQLVAKYGIMADAALAAKAIPTCHIVMISGSAMKSVLEPFYETLFAANPKSVGGTLPDDGFYWIG